MSNLRLDMNQGVAKMGFDKRKDPRVEAETEVRFTLSTIQEMVDQMVSPSKAAGDAWQGAVSRNLSRGGIFLVSKTRLEPHQILGLDLALPGRKEAVRAYAEVIWSHPEADASGQWQFGIQFVAVKGPDADALEEYLKESV